MQFLFILINSVIKSSFSHNFFFSNNYGAPFPVKSWRDETYPIFWEFVQYLLDGNPARLKKIKRRGSCRPSILVLMNIGNLYQSIAQFVEIFSTITLFILKILEKRRFSLVSSRFMKIDNEIL